MSADDSNPSEFISIRATSEFQDDDEALENLVQMKEIQFENTLPKTETSLNTDENESIHVRFSSDENLNQLTLSVGDGGSIKISLTLIKSSISESPSIFDKLSDNLKDIRIVDIDLFREYELPFNSLTLPIKEDSSHEVSGIKINHDAASYVIQSSEDGGNVTLYARWDSLSEDAGEGLSDIGTKQHKKAEEFFESLQ
jgi:hypothetical protein